MKILIASSSSGGHINPSISFGSYLESKGHKVTYLGFKNQIEEKLISNDKLVLINAKNSFKKNLNPLNLFQLIKEIIRLRKELDKYDAYIGFGGFINLILVFLKRNKPLFIHEQNVILGDSNKIVRLFSKKVFYSFPINDSKGILVGNPIGENIKEKEFNYTKSLNILFVFGSLGSKSLINKLKDYDSKLDKRHNYTLINGLSKKNELNYNFKQIKVIDYLSLKDNLDKYDVIISRGGATSLYEIVKSRTYCISIPSPYVKHDHQRRNVDYLLDKNLISKIEEKDLSLSLLNREINRQLDFDFILSRYKDFSKFNVMNSSKLMEEEIIKYVKD